MSSSKEQVVGHNQSTTAQLIAACRAKCTEDPILRRICNDPYAKYFSGGGKGESIAERIASTGRLPNFHIWVATRTAFIDACVVDAVVNGGVDQVVLLGAGYDTRSARLGLAHRARWFEVDAPGPQLDKLERIAAIPTYPLDSATYIPCDFETQNFFDELLRHQFDPTRRTLFIVEGVFYYLTEGAIRSTLETIRTRCDPTSVVVFDMFTKSSIQNPKNSSGVQVLSDVQEPLRWGSNHILPFLFGLGYRHVLHHDFDEACLAATGYHKLSNMYKFQFLVVAQGDVWTNGNGGAEGFVRPLAPLSVLPRLRQSESAKL
jgi:methyltransferase (TIGR00027 family)